jgi:hypothetical protein
MVNVGLGSITNEAFLRINDDLCNASICTIVYDINQGGKVTVNKCVHSANYGGRFVRKTIFPQAYADADLSAKIHRIF